MIDVAIPVDRNVVRKEAEKELKYKSLCTEIQRMWNIKCMIIPVNKWNHRRVTKGLRKNLSHTRKTIDALHKTAVLGTLQIIRKVLQFKT